MRKRGIGKCRPLPFPIGQMRVLADVTALWVRARYHQDQLQSSIYGFRVETAYDPVAGPPAGTAAAVALVPLPSQRARKVHPVEVSKPAANWKQNEGILD